MGNFFYNYAELFRKINDRRIENKKYNSLYKEIQNANKKFLANGIRYYVIPNPYNKYKYYSLSKGDFTRLFQSGVFKFNPNIKQKLEMSLYVTPERLTQQTINEIKNANLPSIMKNILAKVKL